jgi:DNA modification methylase
MSYEVLLGDCIESMKKLPAESVDMCVTSPPYYGLRNYQNDEQIGLEATLGGYINNMVAVFEEVRRILKPQGTLWLNLGDSYNGSGGAGGDYAKGGMREGQPKYPGRKEPSMKRKEIMGVPWRVAFALSEAGWWLRQDIIWNKPNCMPEPVKDRCTKNHEYIFLLTKQEKYFYDHEAIKEPVKEESLKRAQNSWDSDHPSTGFHGEGIHTAQMGKRFVNPTGRNKRSVWTVNPKPYKGAHFAVFPPDLIEPCILAGTSAKGCCSKCGKAYLRLTEGVATKAPSINKKASITQTGGVGTERLNGSQKQYHTVGWEQGCDCNADVVPAVVFDPFGGSGTTAGVAIKNGRKAILCELNEEYAALIPSRIESISQIQKEVLNDEREWL